MKKSELNISPKSIFILTVFILTIFSINQISAVEIEMDSSFAQGQTLLARFSGNFVDQITTENTVFYREHVKIPMVFDVVKIKEDFYVYALLGNKAEGNYSIRVEDVQYMRGTSVVDDTIIANFTITNETAPFSVSPGVVVVKDDFSLEIQALVDRTIIVNSEDDSPSITSPSSVELRSGQIKTLDFYVLENPENGLQFVELSSSGISYKIPVYIDTNETTVSQDEPAFEFQPTIVEVSMATNSEAKRILYLKNTGDEVLYNITFFVPQLLEPYITVVPEEITELSVGETKKIEIEIISDLEEAILEGKIRAETENVTTYLTLVLNFVEDFIPEDGTDDNEVIVPTCEQMDGEKCTSTQECSGNSVDAKDGPCCTTQCQEKTKSSSGKLIGWGLLALVLILIFWFYRRRYRHVMPRRPF